MKVLIILLLIVFSDTWVPPRLRILPNLYSTDTILISGPHTS